MRVGEKIRQSDHHRQYSEDKLYQRTLTRVGEKIRQLRSESSPEI